MRGEAGPALKYLAMLRDRDVLRLILFLNELLGLGTECSKRHATWVGFRPPFRIVFATLTIFLLSRVVVRKKQALLRISAIRLSRYF